MVTVCMWVVGQGTVTLDIKRQPMEWSLSLSIIQQKKKKNQLPHIFILLHPVVSYSRPGTDRVLCLYVYTDLHLLQLCNPETVTLPLAAKANDQPLTAFKASFAWGWMCKSMRASSVVSYQSSDYSLTIHGILTLLYIHPDCVIILRRSMHHVQFNLHNPWWKCESDSLCPRPLMHRLHLLLYHE